MGEWRPIETAPKGVLCLVRATPSGWHCQITMMARYWDQYTLEVAEEWAEEDWVEIPPSNEAGYMPAGWYEHFWGNEPPPHNLTPTKWQPLPKPPVTEGE